MQLVRKLSEAACTMCADDREQRGTETSDLREEEEHVGQFAQQDGELLGVTTLAASTSAHAELERQGEAVLRDLNDDWVAEGVASRQGLESWKVREDYKFDGSLAQRAVDEDCSAFAGFPDDDGSNGAGQPGSSAAPTPQAKSSEKPPFASSLVFGSSVSDSDDSDDDGLFSVVDKHGQLQPAASSAASNRIFGDDDL